MLHVYPQTSPLQIRDALLSHTEKGEPVSLVYVGKTSLLQAIKAVRKANHELRGSGSVLAIVPFLEKADPSSDLGDMFTGILTIHLVGGDPLVGLRQGERQEPREGRGRPDREGDRYGRFRCSQDEIGYGRG